MRGWTRVRRPGWAAYAATRDQLFNPDGTSHLGPDLRFGLLSPVEVVTRVRALDLDGAGPERFVSELAWRDFYAHGLWHEPRLAREPHATPARGPRLAGRRAGLDAWRTGRTGYPIVDAPMRQLVATGSMPNRARMIVASFLTKDLLVDWREGESFFMAHLVDGDPASNLGGWQWAASVGADAQPWFRVFNPVTQGERFDPDGAYVRRWLPELARVPTARDPRPVDDVRRRAGGGRLPDRHGLPGPDRRPRRGAGEGPRLVPCRDASAKRIDEPARHGSMLHVSRPAPRAAAAIPRATPARSPIHPAHATGFVPLR